MAAADYTSLVQSIYISYFGRPADTFGLDSFADQLNTLKAPTTVNGLTAAYKTSAAIKSLIDSFGTSAESTALYGTDTVAFVSAIYANVLNRAADFDGLVYWVNAINSGSLTKGNASLAIMAGAVNNTSAQGMIDAQVLANKVIIATNFTIGIDTGAELTAYVGNTAAATAREMLKTVTSATVPATFQATVDATLALIVTASIPVINVNLTNGVDNLVGAGGNDIFNASIGNLNPANDTLTTLDAIDGKAGRNVLNISDLDVGGTSLPAALNISNIQTVNLQAAGVAKIDTTVGFTGLTALNVNVSNGADNITAGSGTAVTVVDAAGVVTVVGGSTQNVTTSGGVALSKAAGAITVTDLAQDGATSTINGGTSVTVKTTSTATGGVLNIGSNPAILANSVAPTGAVSVTETINGTVAVTGGAINVTGGTVDTINLVATQATKGSTTTNGNVTVTGTAITTSVTVTETAAVAAVVVVTAIAAVTETSSGVFGALAANASLTVAGLTFTASAAGTTAAQTAAAFAGLANNAVQGASTLGAYSGTLSGYSTGAASTATVVFSSSVAGDVTPNLTANGVVFTTTDGVLVRDARGTAGIASGTVAVTDVNYSATPTAAGTIASVSLDGYGASTVQSNALTSLSLANSGAAVAVSNVKATTLGLTLNKVIGGTSSAPVAATLNLDAAAATYTTLNVTTATAASFVNLTAAAVTALNVSGSSALNLTGSTLTALKTVAVSGAAGVTLNASGAAVTDVNVSASTGTNTFTIDASNATYEGGSGTDSLSLTATSIAKGITLGAGNDSVRLALGSSVVTGSIDGGAGTDTLIMFDVDATAASNSALFAAKVTSFETLSLVATTTPGAQTVHLDVLGGFNTVTTGAARSALTLDGFISGGTLNLTSAVNGGSYIVSSSAFVTPTNDVFTINVSNSSGINAGTVTAANIETIKLSVTDTTSTHAPNYVNDTLTVLATAAKSITATGNAHLTLNASGSTAVTSVDASAMTGGLDYTTTGVLAQTVKGGAAHNVLAASTGIVADVLIGGAGNDTFYANSGLNTLTGNGGNDTFVIVASANVNSYATITDANIGDSISFAGLSGSGTEVFAAAKLTLAATAVFQDYANAAINAGGDSSTNSHISWFQFNGDTYVVESNHNALVTHDFQNGTDIVVKLTGMVDLTNTSLSTTSNTLLIG